MSQEPEIREIPAIERRILVVDDEERLVESLASLLGAYGYQADTATTGQQALALLRERDYPVVITDLRIDDIDGFTIMQEAGEGRYTAFIIITGHASTESAIQAVQHKAFDYLPKPFDFEQLLKTVQRAFAEVEARRFRDELISMITHDIKIPLSSIIGYASLIFDKSTGQINPRAKEFAQTIHSNALKILSLIDNFLTSCKIEAGRLTIFPRPVNVGFVVEDLLCVFQADVERKQLRVETDLAPGLPPLIGDENLLFRAISNVVSNAVKFTPPEGKITIRVTQRGRDESPLGCDSICIEVSNTGPGIPAQDLPLIFDKYRRSSAHPHVEGSGLGLYITRYVVEAHEGTIEVESTPNVLTVFRIFFPLRLSTAVGDH